MNYLNFNSNVLRTVLIRCKSTLSRKTYPFPKIDKNDLSIDFISGFGPGGQNVNMSKNCVQMTHVPTGIMIKVCYKIV